MSAFWSRTRLARRHSTATCSACVTRPTCGPSSCPSPVSSSAAASRRPKLPPKLPPNRPPLQTHLPVSLAMGPMKPQHLPSTTSPVSSSSSSPQSPTSLPPNDPPQVHILQLPNPDPNTAVARPALGEDRRTAYSVRSLAPVKAALDSEMCRHLFGCKWAYEERATGAGEAAVASARHATRCGGRRLTRPGVIAGGAPLQGPGRQRADVRRGRVNHPHRRGRGRPRHAMDQAVVSRSRLRQYAALYITRDTHSRTLFTDLKNGFVLSLFKHTHRLCETSAPLLPLLGSPRF